MIDALADFHWLRPWWLLAAAPAAWLHWRLLRRHGRNPWRRLVDPELLPALTEGERRPGSRWAAHGLLAAWLIAVAALSGPTWERVSQPLFQQRDALVVILDLGPSMGATDLKPSRIVRARRKISDLLERRAEGTTALVVFAASAHVVVPLTDDVDTIKSLLPVLEPSLMPAPGNRALAAFEAGLELMERASIPAGSRRVLLLSDGVQNDELDRIAERVNAAGAELFVIGVGTAQGGALPGPGGRRLRRSDGGLMIARLSRGQLRRLAAATGGVYVDMQLRDDDLDRLRPVAATGANAVDSSAERRLDIWQDQGAWLALALLPMLAYAFRRGVVAALALSAAALWPTAGWALDFDGLWRNQAQRDAIRHDDGLALYRQGDYAAAEERFAETDRPHGHYNRGNALARQDELERALDAYDQALAQNPRMEDALFNRALVAALLERQARQRERPQGGQRDDANRGEPGHGDSRRQDPSAGRRDESGSPSPASAQAGEQPEAGEPSDERSARQPAGGRPAAGDEERSPSGLEDDPSGERDGPVVDSAPGAERNPNSERSASARSVQEMRADERRQALAQWLRRLPDDPGALLKRKFRYQYRQQRRGR